MLDSSPRRIEARENGLRVIMIFEFPSNAILADQFLEHFDGFSIGSNDLTQMTLRSIATPARRRGVRRAGSGGHANAASQRSRRAARRTNTWDLRPGSVRPSRSREVA